MKTALFAIAAVIALAAQAHAQDAGALPRNDKILIDYQDALDPEAVEALDPASTEADVKKEFDDYRYYQGLVVRLKERQVLERYAQFLVPLKLPTTLRLVGKECGVVNAFYSPVERSISLCYEYVRHLEEDAPKQPRNDGITRDDAIIGGLVSVLLHETGHAIFNLYKIPLIAREEDAADQIAAYVMLQFGDQVAMTTVKGAMWMWRNNWGVPRTRNTTAVYQKAVNSDVHSTNQQRFITFLCIAYGAKPKVFQPFIDAGYLAPARAATCQRDFQQVERAFIKTVLPHIDRDMMQKVQSANWFMPQDLGTIPVQTR